MTLEERVSDLEIQVKRLSKSSIQLNKNQTDTTGKSDSTSSRVDALTPYTDTKTAYIGDTKVIFKDIPEGNLSVYIKDSKGNYPNYNVERMSDRITVSFDPLKYVTTITISIL